MNKEIRHLENNILYLKINGEEVPKSISEFAELSFIESYEDLKDRVKDKEFSLVIPDHLIHNNFELVATKSDRLLVSFFTYLPFIIAIILTFICLLNESYLGLILVPIVLVGQYLSAFIKNFFLAVGIFSIGIYLAFSNDLTFGSILITFGVSLISSIYYKVFRKMGFHSSAMQSEIIFSFLFYSRNISLIKNSTKQIIQSA